MSSVVKFSKLCESDGVVYSEYLASVRYVEYCRNPHSFVNGRTGGQLGKCGEKVTDFGYEAIQSGGNKCEACKRVVGSFSTEGNFVGAGVQSVYRCEGSELLDEVTSVGPKRNGNGGELAESFVVHGHVVEEIGQGIDNSGRKDEGVLGKQGDGANFGVGSKECVGEEQVVVEPVVCVSERTLANRARRAVAKEKKKAHQAGMRRDTWRKLQEEDQKTEARKTLEARWVCENELAVERAKQELEMLKKRDVVKEVKKREALVMKKTEVSRVAVERAYGTLKATGNVPGFCETVVSGASVPSLSGGSGSVSPNSSVSEADIWRMKKELEDAKAECIRLRKEIGDDRLEKLKKDETVAYTVENFTEELEKELEEKIPGGIQTQFSNFDPSTVYVHKDRNYDEFTQAYEELF